MTLDETIRVRWAGGEERYAPGVRVLIGRDTDCQLTLQHGSVSRHHAELVFEGNQWTLRDLGSTQGTHQDGRRITEVPITGTVTVVFGNPTEGDRVELSADDLRTEAVPPTIAPRAMPVAGTELPQRPGGELRAEQLSGATVVTGQGLNVACGTTSVTVQPGQELVIGRDAACDIQSHNPTVSRRHLRFHHDGSGWVAEDLESSGGSFVDGRRTNRIPLAGSTAIWLGDPDTGERVIAVTAGERVLTTSQRIERASRGRGGLILAGIAVVAVIALVAGVLALRGGGSSTPDNTELAKATVKLIVDEGWGSGTVIDAKQGLILTNAHVVKPQAPGQALEAGVAASDLPPDPSEIIVAIAPDLDKAAEPKFTASVVAYDGYLDLAVVKIDKTTAGALIEPGDLRGLHEIDLGDSDAVRSGDPIRVVGFPGVAESAASTLTTGVISGTVGDARLDTNRAYLNISAEIAPGNSGGLAVDDKGRLIGVPTLSRNDKSTLSKINSMRAIDLGKPMIEAAKKGQDYTSPYVRTLTGRESLSRFDLITPTVSKGFDLGCANASTTSASAGDTSISLAFDYSGFEQDAHQDVLVAVLDAQDVVGSVATTDQFPFRWKESGTACATIPLASPLSAGTYSIVVLVGPNYERSASDLTFTVR